MNITNTSDKVLQEKLEAIIESEPDTIRAEVAQEAIDSDDIIPFFSYLLQNGCVSGVIGPLIYYVDTHAFYDKYYDEIENLRYETEESQGLPITIKGDLKNFFAWFGFEETAYQLANELGLEI